MSYVFSAFLSKKPTTPAKYVTAFSELDWQRLIVMTNKRKTKGTSSLKEGLKTADRPELTSRYNNFLLLTLSKYFLEDFSFSDQ